MSKLLLIAILALTIYLAWRWWRSRAAPAPLTCPRCGVRGQIHQRSTGAHWVSRCDACGFEWRLGFRN